VNTMASRPKSKRDYLSFSALSLYATCPLRYYFRYVACLSEETISASLVFGAALHAGVELHFRELLAGNAAPSLDALLYEFQMAWKSRSVPEVQFPAGENLDTFRRLAERMFRAFQASDFARPSGTIIGVEEELRGPISTGLPDLLARVDLLIDADDALVVTDFKTSRCRWSQDHVIEASRQLLLYHELAGQLGNGKPVKLEFAVLTKAKMPELVLHDVPADVDQLQRTKRIAERVWRAIESRHFYPSPSPLNCTACPYRRACLAWSG
jgi:CRISPR/Cas system-associated exonuclease Cas4 (RecB family)